MNEPTLFFKPGDSSTSIHLLMFFFILQISHTIFVTRYIVNKRNITLLGVQYLQKINNCI